MKNYFLVILTFTTLLLSSCDGLDCSTVDCPLQGSIVQITINVDGSASGIDVSQVNISSTSSDLAPEIRSSDFLNTVNVWFKAEGAYQLSLGDRLASVELEWTEVVGDCCTVTDLQSFIVDGVELCTEDCSGPFTITL